MAYSLAGDILQALTAKPKPPWLGADLQTLRNTIVKPKVDLSPWPHEVINIALPGGDDRTTGFFHQSASAQSARCTLIIHGLGGDADGDAIRFLASSLLRAGMNIVRINLRAAPMVQHLASNIAHAGKTDDLAAIFKGLEAALGRKKWSAIGISLGGNLLLKSLASPSLKAFDIVNAMSICAPIDMKAASNRILEPRNALYARYLLNALQKAVLNTNMDARWKAKAKAARTVFEFDDAVTGPFHGFGTADTYYATVSAGPHLKAISCPTLVLHAQDDPWIPAKSYAPYTPANTRGPVQMVIVPRGGHVGFHLRGFQAPAYCYAANQWVNQSAAS